MLACCDQHACLHLQMRDRHVTAVCSGPSPPSRPIPSHPHPPPIPSHPVPSHPVPSPSHPIPCSGPSPPSRPLSTSQHSPPPLFKRSWRGTALAPARTQSAPSSALRPVRAGETARATRMPLSPALSLTARPAAAALAPLRAGPTIIHSAASKLSRTRFSDPRARVCQLCAPRQPRRAALVRVSTRRPPRSRLDHVHGQLGRHRRRPRRQAHRGQRLRVWTFLLHRQALQR